MTWIQFFMWMAAIYLFYYAINILIDSMMRSRASPNEADTARQELTFFEDVKPHRLDQTVEESYLDEDVVFADDEDDNSYLESPIETSGGVSLKSLFDLARTESIEFTKSVTF
ncbi:MAG: hypothetical protein EON51_02165 [Acinetobacter sp.]|nr:MAG: hypothetical protein EON51_02165 [Acinetobacter sp.]